MRVLALTLAVFVLLSAPSMADEPEATPLERALASPPATGLLVMEVVPNTQAATLGMRPGDVIVTYDEAPTDSIDALRTAVRAAAAKPTVTLKVVRADASEHAFEVTPGQIGVQLAPVKKGEGVAPVPPDSGVAFDFGALATAPHDAWFAFHLAGQEGKRGFEHAVLTLADGKLRMRREVAFDGGERWGVNHFDVTVVATAGAMPRLVSWTFELPIPGGRIEGRLLDDAGQAKLEFSAREATGQVVSSFSVNVPEGPPLVPSYLVESLACFLPREPGTCFRFRPVVDGSGAIGRLTALVGVGEEVLGEGEDAVRAFKFEQRTRGGGAVTTFWIDAKGHVARADYGGATTRPATKEEALENLHPEIKPRTVE